MERLMNIFVCIKEIQNPDLSAEVFRVDEANKAVIPVPGMSLVSNPFDEQALEAALRLRDAGVEVKITAITLGPRSAQAALKRALSMGADSAILISDEGLAGLDAVGVATVLCRAMERSGPVDLVLAGRQGADWDAGVVGCAMAEILGIPVITLAKSVAVAGPDVVVERVLDRGFETVQAPVPCVITIANELGEPRKASLRETMRAAKKPTVVHDAAALGVTAELLEQCGSRRIRERLFVPVNDNTCEMFAGATAQDIAARLAERLREAKCLHP